MVFSLEAMCTLKINDLKKIKSDYSDPEDKNWPLSLSLKRYGAKLFIAGKENELDHFQDKTKGRYEGCAKARTEAICVTTMAEPGSN